MKRKPQPETTRADGGNYELAVMQAAVNSVVTLFNTLTQFQWSQGHKREIEALVTRIQTRQHDIRAVLDFDTDGALTFKFYELRNGKTGREIMDATPTRKVN
ncbi:hypothetical protein [Haliea sp. E17]|uniref:hypothetical protein n=1 Tax=Haliea sp. E17 TaxID=3401576 RepID=UPI003AB02540